MQHGYHHGNLREEILKASVELIDEKGTRGFSLREAARRIGVSHNAASYHFPSRHDVLIAVAAEGFNLFADELERAVEAGPGRYPELPRRNAGLVAMGMAYFRFSVEHTAYFRTMFGDAPGTEKTDDPAFRQANDRALSALYDNVRDALNPVGEQELRSAGMYLWAHTHGLTLLHIDNVLVFQLQESEKAEQFVYSQITACVRDLLERSSKQ